MRAAFLFLFCAAAAPAQSSGTVTRVVFHSITAPATSSLLPEIEQEMHIVTVMATAPAATITGVDVRLEASFDQQLWFSIAPDVVALYDLASTGGRAIASVTAYCSYPFLRVRSLTTANTPITITYTAQVQPVLTHFNKLVGGRLIL